MREGQKNDRKKKKATKLGSRARKALRESSFNKSNLGEEVFLTGGFEEEEELDEESLEEEGAKTKFSYDEREDVELVRLRNMNWRDDAIDDSNRASEHAWEEVVVDASDLMLGSVEDGFVCLEVFASSKKTKKSKMKEKMTAKEKTKSVAAGDEEKRTNEEEEEEEEEEGKAEKGEDERSNGTSKKERRIMKRKLRWKEKCELAKAKKKMMKKEEEEEEDVVVNDDDDLNENNEDLAAWLEYDLHPLLMKGLRKLNFSRPTAIQEKVLHPAIKGRMDIVGAAETGSGKTLAFGLPILQRLMQDEEESKWYEDYDDEEIPGKGKKHLRALIIAPTRELALQVSQMIRDVACFTNIQIAAIVGGISKQKQERLLKKQPEIIVATPGRLWELIRDGDKHLMNLERLSFLTLDEADRMVEKGHFKELESIIKSIPEPPETKRIARSAKLTKRKQPVVVLTPSSSSSKSNKKKRKDISDDDEDEDNDEEENGEEENEKSNRIMARDRQTFVFSATLTVPDEVKYKLDRKKPPPASSSKKAKKNKGNENDDAQADDGYRLEPPKDLAETNTMGNLMKMVPFYGRVKLCDVGNDNNNGKKKEKSRADDENNAGKTTRVASNVHEAALECTDDERDALTLYLLSAHAGKPSIVFVNAISSLRRLTALLKIMKVNVVGLHAGMQQRARLKALDRFKSASASALIATDVAARGLDIKGVELVVHYQIPRQADAYVHRCGRTGRANNSGVSVALVIPKERSRYLAMLAAMGREKGFRLPAFPVAEETVREATKRVQLAKRLDQIVHKNEKAKADKTWKKRTAAAMDIGLDSDDDDFDDDLDDDEGEYNNNFSDNEDGVEVIDFDNLKKPFKNNESQKKLQKEAEKRNITKREIGLRNQLDELLSKPLGSLRRSNVTSLKFPTREGKGIISINYKTSNSSSALDILTGRTNNSNFITAGAVAGGAGGARKKQKKLKN